MSTWKPIVKNIKETDQVSDKVVNVPLSQLAERTDYLKAVMENVTASEFNFIKAVAVSAVAKVGEAVYWDSENNRFGRALAGWDDELSPYGSLLPAESAYMAGILINKRTGNTGDVILSGYIKGFSELEALFGTASPDAGIYYVSGNSAGQLTQTPPPMSIPAVMYDGFGNILMLPTNSIVSQHDHNNYRLDKLLWIPANSSNFPGMDIPDGAIWGYDLNNADPDMFDLLTLYTGTGSFVLYESGTILNDTYIEINDNNVWVKDTLPPIEDIIAHIAQPDAHGPSIIREARTDTEAYISLSVVNGTLNISFKDASYDPNIDDSFTVVKDIVDNIMKRGPVATQVVAGEGISVSSEDNEGHGRCVVSLLSESDKIVDADIVNLNNAIQRTDGGLVYSVFPGNRDSSMSLVVNNGRWSGADRGLIVRLWMKGTGDVTPAFRLKILVFPNATVGGVDMPTEVSALIEAGSEVTDINKYYLCEAVIPDTLLLMPSGSQIQYNIEPVNRPSEDYLILRQGITSYIIAP